MSDVTRRELGLLSLSLLMGTGLSACSIRPPAKPSSGRPSFYENLAQPGKLLDAEAAARMISDYRLQNGLSRVTLDQRLMRLASRQAEAMASSDNFSHSATGSSFELRISASGIPTRTAAENISAGYLTMAEAFSGWRDSPSHRKNMLLAGATHMGIAASYAPNTKYRVFWAMVIAGL